MHRTSRALGARVHSLQGKGLRFVSIEMPFCNGVRSWCCAGHCQTGIVRPLARLKSIDESVVMVGGWGENGDSEDGDDANRTLHLFPLVLHLHQYSLHPCLPCVPSQMVATTKAAELTLSILCSCPHRCNCLARRPCHRRPHT